MRVLGIETSCDETGVAIYDTALPGLIAHAVYSQIAIHAEYGGVVPELASRDHVRKLLPLIRQTMAEAGLVVRDLDGVAYTAGPGLAGALLVGAGVARALAWALDLPAVAVHHMEGHLLAPLMQERAELRGVEHSARPQPPFIALLVSGGHTQLIAVQAIGHYRLLGETLDDAVGEAFDKTAKLMGLPYPGGPQLAALAETGTPGAYRFSRPMTDRGGLDFSFSGLKTQVLLAWQGSDQTDRTRADIARGFEDAVVDTLAIKCARALDATGSDVLVISGGVGANLRLRARLQAMCQARGGRACFPPPALCTDNGAMIAYAGALRLQAGQRDDAAVRVSARWDMAALPALAEAAYAKVGDCSATDNSAERTARHSAENAMSLRAPGSAP